MFESFPDQLDDQIVWLVSRIKQMEARERNRQRQGVIEEVNLKDGLARVKLDDGDDGPFLTGWIPWKEVASGKIKTSFNPSVGEQVDVYSENGELTDAVIDMSTPSNSNPRPHDGVEAVIECNGGRFEIGETVKVIAPSKIEMAAPKVEITGDVNVAGKLTNNGVNVGEDHKHKDVTTGSALSGVPLGN